MNKSKTDYLIKVFTEQPNCKELMQQLSSMVLSTSVVWEVDEDTVLGVIVTLVKAHLATKKELKEDLTEINGKLNELLGLSWDDLTKGN